MSRPPTAEEQKVLVVLSQQVHGVTAGCTRQELALTGVLAGSTDPADYGLFHARFQQIGLDLLELVKQGVRLVVNENMPDGTGANTRTTWGMKPDLLDIELAPSLLASSSPRVLPPEHRDPDPRAVARPPRSAELPGQGLRVPVRLGAGVPPGGDGRVQRRHLRRSRRPARRGAARPARAAAGPGAHSGHPPGTAQERRSVGPRPGAGLGGPDGQPGLAPQPRLPGHGGDGCRGHARAGRAAGGLAGGRGPGRPGGDRGRAGAGGPDQAALPGHVQQRFRPERGRQGHRRSDPHLPHRGEEGPDRPRPGAGRRRHDRGLPARVRAAEHSARRDESGAGAVGRTRHRCCDPGAGRARRLRDARVHQREEASGRPPRAPRPAGRTGRPDRIAAVGYGTGGAIALELGRGGVDLRAIGTVNALTTGRPGEAARIGCPVWAGLGSEDPIMPPAQRDAFTAEMQAAGVDWRLVVYGGALHAFHHPPVDHPVVPGVGHHPRHAQRAWRDVVDLLAECLPVTE